MHPHRQNFRPRPPWFGGTLQTIRGVRWPLAASLPPGHRLWIPLPDGDQLAASLHWPEPPGRETATPRPLALLVHGLTGTEDDACLRAAARALLARGFPVLRLNLRGNALSRPRSRSHYHFGRPEDLRDVLLALPSGLTRPRGVVLAGWSLGGALVLNLLARHASEPEMPPLLAGAAISPELDPVMAVTAIDEHPVFGPVLLATWRREVLAVEGATDLSDRLRVAATRAKSLREFEENVTAPRFGYPSYATMAELHRPDRALPEIRVPTLLLTAADDPVMPVTAFDTVDWSACPAVAPVRAAGGGHCGFEDRRTVRDNLQARAIAAFLEGAAADQAAIGAIASAADSQGEGSVPSSTAQAEASTAPA